jgi:hypothetical protein
MRVIQTHITIEIIHRMARFAIILYVCGVLLSYFTEEIGSYIHPKMRIWISSTYKFNLMFHDILVVGSL